MHEARVQLLLASRKRFILAAPPTVWREEERSACVQRVTWLGLLDHNSITALLVGDGLRVQNAFIRYRKYKLVSICRHILKQIGLLTGISLAVWS